MAMALERPPLREPALESAPPGLGLAAALDRPSDAALVWALRWQHQAVVAAVEAQDSMEEVGLTAVVPLAALPPADPRKRS